ncbi:hypothetical protein ACF0H5_015605 [Mactra antiquata]
METMPPSGNGSTDVAITIGILEIQGAFLEHRVALTNASQLLGNNVKLQITDVRTPDDIKEEIDGLIIPGGESTTISIYLRRNGLEQPLKQWIQTERHVTWGTCAGMILLSKMTDNQKIGGQTSLAIMDTEVSRNYFGRQVQSFEADIRIKDEQLKEIIQNDTFPGIFIRAPAIVKTLNEEVSILATVPDQISNTDVIVAAKQGNVISTAFHPELTEDCSWHLYFLRHVINNKI